MTQLEQAIPDGIPYDPPMKRVELYLSHNEAERLLLWFRKCCLRDERDLEPEDYRLSVKIGDAKRYAEADELEFV
jgi:hypothetical protein